MYLKLLMKLFLDNHLEPESFSEIKTSAIKMKGNIKNSNQTEYILLNIIQKTKSCNFQVLTLSCSVSWHHSVPLLSKENELTLLL